jgi:hypothetical protein
MTRSVSPLPKLRVTFRSSTLVRPQEAHNGLCEVDSDDEETPSRPNFDNGLCFEAVERAAADDAFDFASFAVPLSLDNLAGEDDAFEVNDREVFIFKLFGCMGGYDIVQRTNQFADANDGRLCHMAILSTLLGCLTCEFYGQQKGQLFWRSASKNWSDSIFGSLLGLSLARGSRPRSSSFSILCRNCSSPKAERLFVG